mmetsp:Transcript_27231/g.85768  ORF Transcript_27231/g.85768 Transcript_27231/m.85768 type:complete len:418 (-) Transcript_27231:462-1715(-)
MAYDLDDEGPLPSEAELADILSFDMSSLTLGNVIGRGHFSQVLLAKRPSPDVPGTEEIVAVKRQVRSDKQFEGHMLRELVALRLCQQANVLQLIGACDEPGRHGKHVLWIVTEFARGGNLLQLLESEHEISWQLRVRICHDAACGLQHLHSSGQIHRDVKSSNFLLSEDFTCKVADLGMAREFEKESTPRRMTICGTEDYMAPELIFDEHYDGKVDVFGLGMVLFEVMARRAIGSYDEDTPTISPAVTPVKGGRKRGERTDSEDGSKSPENKEAENSVGDQASKLRSTRRRKSKRYSLSSPEPVKRISTNPSRIAAAIGENIGFLRRSPHNRFRFEDHVLRDAAPPDSPPSLVELAVQCVSYEAGMRPDLDVMAEWLEDLRTELGPSQAKAQAQEDLEVRRPAPAVRRCISTPGPCR